jgi:hypothetical protein
MPTVCPVDPETGLCASEGRAFQTGTTITLASFLFVFMILLVKTPAYSPSNIGFINCAVIAGALFACAGCSSLLGGGLNPAACLGVIMAHDSQKDLHTTNLLNEAGTYWRAYLFCPLIGGALAGWLNRLHVSVLDTRGRQLLSQDNKREKLSTHLGTLDTLLEKSDAEMV